MKDQVDALQSAGVAATFLNSSLAAGESRPRLRGLHHGEFRLLYVAPERLMTLGFLEALETVGSKPFADRRGPLHQRMGPRFPTRSTAKIAGLRNLFPACRSWPSTATATDRVRGDIVRQLQLRDPRVLCRQFRVAEPDLSRGGPKPGPTSKSSLLSARSRGEGGIILRPGSQDAESMAASSRRRHQGAAYHAGLGLAPTARGTRRRFCVDETRVICAHRLRHGHQQAQRPVVIHYDLPKNMKLLIRKRGRAGRERACRANACCCSGPATAVKQMRFIDEKPDAQERGIARAQLEQMIH